MDSQWNRISSWINVVAALCIITFVSACAPDTTDAPTKTQAALQAQDLIKEKFANDCDFDDMDIRGEQRDSTFVVYQQFTSSRPGYERQFVYKAIADYVGGDVYDDNSWNVRTVIVEDKGTGKQWIYGE